MSRIEAKKIVAKYAKKLRAQKIPFSAIYLFGSYAHGKPTKWSDIDVAIITEKIKKNRDANILKLWRAREDIDNRIEPHSFTMEDFNDYWNPMAHEIKKTGIKIA
ncbi:MAG TPA: nucleotidyltransferase [Candidatus Moranbacteria bacterium]|nr:nucleotidyltransferase [Candidatus Moranbacteria bacterium]HAT75149.1 nucleotidyltransferase [Candidatus Moranbacteria bacterium]